MINSHSLLVVGTGANKLANDFYVHSVLLNYVRGVVVLVLERNI